MLGQKIKSEKLLRTKSQTSGIVAVFETLQDVHSVMWKLEKTGFEMKNLSVVARDFKSKENVIGFHTKLEETKRWGKAGALWGGLWGAVFGTALLFIPGIGSIVISGTLTSTVISALEGAAVIGGLSILGAALFNIGVPESSIIEYETALKAGKYVVIANGTHDDLFRAREIFSNRDFVKNSKSEPVFH